MADMTYMRQSPEERAAKNGPLLSDETNHDMCFVLSGPELEKLDLDDMPERNDLLHFCAMGRVEDITDGPMGKRIRIEIIAMGVIENETEEEKEGMSDEERMEGRYGGDEEEEERQEAAANIGLPVRRSVPRVAVNT